jgi:flagellar hook assembly protein FlgD
MEIGSTSEARNDSSQTQNTLERSGLDREAFLKLFMAQLEHQDPLNPQDATELASQLAQFSQFEQSLRMVEELQAINSRLDALVEANESQTTQTFDPLALLGHQVDLQGDRIIVPSDGTASPLRFELPEAAQAIGISVRDESGQSIGQAVLQGVSLAPGTYQLEPGPTGSLLRTSGGSTPLEFVRVSSENDAVRVVLGDDGAPAPFSFEPGRAYRFAVGATNMNGELVELGTTITGTVEAVRNASENPVVVVNGQETDLSNVIRIR